jgi:Gas vesicle synthesis protein GvpL/GvpF
VTEPHGLWVYAVAERVPAAGVDQAAAVGGVGGGQVRTVTAAGLTAIAGDVPLEEFGEAALRRNLEDLAWLEETARAHHRVIEAVARRCPVVPMRLATVYRGEASVGAALAERRDDFRAALGRTSGRKEWGVKAYAAGPAKAGTDPGPERGVQGGQSEHGAERGGAGAAYLRRRRSELSAQRDARRELMASAELVHARLSRLAADSRLHPPQAPQLTGTSAKMLLNAAYLVDEQRDEDLTAAVRALAAKHPGVRLELTGPWPPYSFAGLGQEEDQR